jgi:hypothetical protein
MIVYPPNKLVHLPEEFDFINISSAKSPFISEFVKKTIPDYSRTPVNRHNG